MSIQNILDRNRAEVVTISPTDVKSAADRMRAHDIAALVVKSDAAITGLISDREIVHAASRHGEGALYMAVLEVLTPPPTPIAPDATPPPPLRPITHPPPPALPPAPHRQLLALL